MKKLICILLALMPVFISCVKRDWTNPFSSDCPKEIWTPTNFAAVQEGTTVKLTWIQPINNISGFKIQKSVDGSAAGAIQDQTKGATQLTDNSLTGGKMHLYSLTAFAGSNTSNTVTAQITPILMAGITTMTVSAVGAATAQSGGTISSDGGAAITARGICWATTQNPTIAGTKTTDGTGMGNFASSMTGLSPGTTYYLRAYAINSVGTAYGNELTLTTSVTLPAITTTALSAITSTTAASGGTITATGGAAITARGVCWGTVSGPTILNSKTTDGAGTGTYPGAISGLIPGTTYYIRAYATNSAGTAYGNELTLTTNAVISTITTTALSSIASTTAASGGNITSDGGATIIARGVCWGTVQGPTIAGTKSTDGIGTGNFASSINGLTPGTTYYVRAYAINSAGTAYGNELSFITAATLSTLTTTAISSVTATTASGGGNITADGGAAITARGVCWGTAPGPTVLNNKSTDGFGTGNFSSSLTGLLPGTTYYVRSYAINSAGAAYGNEITFSSTATGPILTTSSISAITIASAICGGNITTDGGATITARGVCWSTTSGPTVLNNKTADGAGIGSYFSTISGLIPGTAYYVRAYASNSSGTAYGNEVTFSSTATLPTLTTTAISTITASTAACGGNITTDGGATITARGVCWAMTSNPTITNNRTTDGAGTGSFTSALSGLLAGTTYFVRAYAVNSTGTAYGAQVSFTSLANSPATVVDVEGNIYKTVTIGTQVWMAENLKTTKYNDGTAIPMVTDNTAWAKLSTPAYCWSNNDILSNKDTFGALYNWYTINTGKLCPTGWHVPNDYEWTVLTTYLGGENVAGSKLKEIGTSHWGYPNSGASNSTGFTALPGGSRQIDGTFGGVSGTGVWWTSTNANQISAWARNAIALGSAVGRYSPTMLEGYSIRCVRTDFTQPNLSTSSTSNITSSSATSGGDITTDGGSIVSARGVCWSTYSSPTTSDNRTNDGAGTGVFTSFITGLVPGTTYFVRAFATNGLGTVYGSEVSFKTLAALPTLSTSAISSILAMSATGGGTISSNGGGIVTARGVCWSTTSNPTINNSKTIDGAGTGSFLSAISGLASGTTYYVRAFATNSAGTAYGNEVSFKTNSNSGANDIIFNPNLTYGSVTDVDGNTYKTIQIGTQTWMTENLKATKYNDNTAIPLVSDNTTWANLTSSGYCWFNNDAATNKSTYGALYNWYTVNTGKLCPTGWHVPSDAEWTVLTTFLGGDSIAGGKLKETGTSHWLSPNYGASNTTGFTAVPGGFRSNNGGTFNDLGSDVYWWTSSAYLENYYAWHRYIVYHISNVYRWYTEKQFGLSVRCLRDN